MYAPVFLTPPQSGLLCIPDDANLMQRAPIEVAVTDSDASAIGWSSKQGPVQYEAGAYISIAPVCHPGALGTCCHLKDPQQRQYKTVC